MYGYTDGEANPGYTPLKCNKMRGKRVGPPKLTEQGYFKRYPQLKAIKHAYVVEGSTLKMAVERLGDGLSYALVTAISRSMNWAEARKKANLNVKEAVSTAILKVSRVMPSPAPPAGTRALPRGPVIEGDDLDWLQRCLDKYKTEAENPKSGADAIQWLKAWQQVKSMLTTIGTQAPIAQAEDDPDMAELRAIVELEATVDSTEKGPEPEPPPSRGVNPSFAARVEQMIAAHDAMILEADNP